MKNLEALIQELCPDGVEFVKIGDLASVGTGRSNRQDAVENGQYPFFVRSKTILASDTFEFDDESIIIPGEGGIGEIFHYINGKYALHQRVYRINFHDERVCVRFAYYYMFSNFKRFIMKKAVSATVTSIRKPMIEKFEIPLPPIEVQNEIVRILDKFTELEAELDCRKRQYEYYRDKLLSFENVGGQNVEWKKMSEVIYSINTGLNPRRFFRLNTIDAHNYYVTIKEMKNGNIVFNDDTDMINDDALKLCNNRSHLEKGDLIFSGTGTIGQIVVLKETPTNWNIKEGLYSLKPIKEKIDSKYMAYILNETSIRKTYMKKALGGTVKSVPMKVLTNIKIPIPPLAEQERIVSILDRFESLTTSLTAGLPAEIAARRQQYEHYRDKLLTFKRKSA